MKFFWGGELSPGMASGGGGIGGSTGTTDNRLLRADGTGGSTVQSSAISVDDTGNVTLPARLLGKQGADVASGTDLILGSGNYFYVTGTTAIHGIVPVGWAAGSVVILQFEGSVTVNHNGAPDTADALLLAGAANFSATAGDILGLVRDEAAGVWREVFRTVI